MKIDIGKKIKKTDLCPGELLKLQEQAYAIDIKKLKEQMSSFVKINCPACGSKQNKNFFKKYDFNFKLCQKCETIFMSPRPSQKIMDEYYRDSENYKFWAEYIFPKSEKIRKNEIHKLWINRIINFLKKYKLPHKSLLEVGSGYGTFGSLVASSNFIKEYVGVEPTPELAEICEKRKLSIIKKK